MDLNSAQMKFEEQLDVAAVPEWRSEYVNYSVCAFPRGVYHAI